MSEGGSISIWGESVGHGSVVCVCVCVCVCVLFLYISVYVTIPCGFLVSYCMYSTLPQAMFA